jgi:hypothetical protein
MFAAHLIPFRNKKNGKHKEKKTTERYKIKKKLFKTSSKRKWVFSLIKLSLEGAEHQMTGIHLEGFLKNVENLLELLVSVKSYSKILCNSAEYLIKI